MMYPARTTRPKSIAQQIGNSMSQLSRRIDWIVPPPTRSSVANDAHRRVVHESACRRPTPCGIDLPTINHAKGRNRCRADAAHFDALRDKRTGNENRLLNHLFLSFRADLDRRIGKRGAGRDENRNASSYYTLHTPKYTRWLAAANRQTKPDRTREGVIPPTFTRDSDGFAGIELELLRQARVPEPVRRIVSGAGIILTVSLFAGCRRRILIE
jgi:hypothetical protein